MKISCTYSLKPKEPSLNAQFVQSQFGIQHETGERIIARDVEINLKPGAIVLFSGPSGSGKSSLLRAVIDEIRRDEGPFGVFCTHEQVYTNEELQKPVIDLLPGSPEANIRDLSTAGLADAILMLRTLNELSDGQRYRARIAHALAGGHTTIAADEWCSTLDRITARVLCKNVRRIATKKMTTFLLATAHDDLEADLEPDITIRCDGKGGVDVVERPFAENRRSASRTNYGSVRAPNWIGRTSLSGTTAATV